MTPHRQGCLCHKEPGHYGIEERAKDEKQIPHRRSQKARDRVREDSGWAAEERRAQQCCAPTREKETARCRRYKGHMPG